MLGGVLLPLFLLFPVLFRIHQALFISGHPVIIISVFGKAPLGIRQLFFQFFIKLVEVPIPVFRVLEPTPSNNKILNRVFRQAVFIFQICFITWDFLVALMIKDFAFNGGNLFHVGTQHIGRIIQRAGFRIAFYGFQLISVFRCIIVPDVLVLKLFLPRLQLLDLILYRFSVGQQGTKSFRVPLISGLFQLCPELRQLFLVFSLGLFQPGHDGFRRRLVPTGNQIILKRLFALQAIPEIPFLG